MRYKIIVLIFLNTISGLALQCQSFVPGLSYLGENGYAEYIHGNLPIILSAPHGGELKPIGIPDRDCNGCVYINDTNTQELSRELSQRMFELTGCYPHLIINKLHRSKLDANREIIEAADGNTLAEGAWNYFHNHIDSAKYYVNRDFGKGLFIDIHGHGHEIQRLELGYLLSRSDLEAIAEDGAGVELIGKTSIKNLVSNNLNQFDLENLIMGDFAIGSIVANRSYDAVPSFQDPYPFSGDSYFTGGYNTKEYGSRDSGTIDAIQIECNQEVRFVQSLRERFVDSLALSIVDFVSVHYFEDFNDQACLVSGTSNVPIGIKIYPNPIADYLFIEKASQGDLLICFDVFGRIVHKEKIRSEFHKVNLHKLPQGTYYYILKRDDNIFMNDVFVKSAR